MFLDCRLGPTLHKKPFSQISYFSDTTAKPSGQVKLAEGDVDEGVGGQGGYVDELCVEKGDVEEVEEGAGEGEEGFIVVANN